MNAGRKPRAKPTRAPRAASTAREVAASVVAAVLDDGKFVGPALDAALNRSSLDARDRALCTELSLGTLRWAKPLEASLLRGADKPGRGLDSRLRPHLLVAAYQLQHLDERVPAHAAVSEAMKSVVKVRPGLRGFANALLRKLGSPLHALLSPNASLDDVAMAYGIPLALAKATCDGLDVASWRDAIAALNARPPLSIALLDDDIAGASEELRTALGEHDVDIAFHPFVPGVFLAHGAGAPERLPGFSQGRFVVQDPGSRLVALLAGPKRGAHVVDLCAAPGTKTLGLAHATGIRGSVVAVDIDRRRLALVDESATRAGLGAAPIRTHCEDAIAFAKTPAHQGAFDVVLLDAPCSSLGTTRRHPEVCFRERPDELQSHAALQREILEAALGLVAPGGRLVYAVCSPMPIEGRDHLDALLVDHGDRFRIRPASEVIPSLPADAIDALGALRLRPHLHAADAFYAFAVDRI